MFALDHVAIGCRDLAEGRARAEAALGVPLQDGGVHARYGTRNALLALEAGLYLEVIAPDPGTPAPESWFGLRDFAGPPRLVNWICRAADLDAALAVFPEAGPAEDMARGDLRWRIGVPPGGGLPRGGAMPTLISWAAGTRHPAARLEPRGVALTAWEVFHPEAADIEAALAGWLDDARVRFVTAPVPGFRAVFSTPDGSRVLS